MRKAVWLLVALNVVALALAYMVAQRAPDGRAGEAILWRLDPAALTRVESRDADRVVTILPETSRPETLADADGGRRILWVTVQAADGTASGVPFQGNEIARRLVQNLAVLKARRRLGTSDGDSMGGHTLAEYGLASPVQTIILEHGKGEPLRLQVGRATYGGAQRYVRKDGDAAVYLLPNPIVARFAAPQRLLDRTVLPRERRDAQRLRLQWQGRTLDLWRTAAASGEGWAMSADGAPLPAAKTVVDSLAGLAVAAYETPARIGADDAPRLTVEFFAEHADPAYWLRAYGDDATPLLVTSYTRHPVQAVNAGVTSLLKHVAALFAAQ